MRVRTLEVRDRNNKPFGKYEIAQPSTTYRTITVLAAPHDTGRISKLEAIAVEEWEKRTDSLLKDFDLLFAECGFVLGTQERYVILHLAKQGMYVFTQTHVPIRYEP